MTDKPVIRFTFKKSARLSSKKDIKELFEKGSSFFLFPFKVLYLANPDKDRPTHQVLITVPKKHHKTAVNRNRIKRLIREAYRQNQHIISEVSEEKLLIAYIYVSEEVLQFKELETKLKKVLLRLKSRIEGKKSSKPE